VTRSNATTRAAESSDGRGELLALGFIALLTLAALALRLANLDFALPYQQEPDTHILGQVEALSKPDVSERDIFFSSIYPHLIARTALLTGAGPVQGAAPQAPLDEHLAAASALHVHVRRVVAWLSVLLVPATYWLCRLFQGRGPALFAAALAATSLFSLQFGQQARPHAAVAPLVGFAVAAAVRLRRKPSTLSFAGFGAWFALALGCLTNGAAAGLSAFPAYFLRTSARGWRRWFDARALLPVAFAALALRAFWPFLFVPAPPDAAASSGAPEIAPSSGPLFRAIFAGLLLGVGVLGCVADWLRPKSSPRLRWGAAALALAGAAGLFAMRGETVHVAWQTIRLADFAGGGFELLFTTLWFYEPVALLLFAVGVAAWLRSPRADPTRERAKDLVVVLAFAAVYALVIGLFEKNQQRFAMPLLPFVYCGAARGMSALGACVGRVVKAASPRANASFVAALALATPVFATAGYVGMRSRPHTLEQVAQWLRANAAPGRDKIALHLLYDVPLAREERNLFDAAGAPRAIFSPWQRYQQTWMRRWSGERWNIEFLYGDRTRWPWIAQHPQEYVAGLEADFVICSGEAGANANPMMAAVRDAVRARGEQVASFPDEVRPPNSGLSGLDTPHFTRFVSTGRWFGPEVEIYRLRSAAQGR
jgi:4-amino-4-deoxy-L-arabinose transferase-like glycosyltransferase